jgi:hypothetical protein
MNITIIIDGVKSIVDVPFNDNRKNEVKSIHPTGKIQCSTRRFRPKGGFIDGTRWIEDNIVVDSNYNKIVSPYFEIKYCLNQVNKGFWEEMDPYELS